MSIQIIHADVVDGLRQLSDQSVHEVVTSPPYDDLRTYGQPQKVTWNFEGVAHELYRVLCDGGIVCWNVNDSVINGSETLTGAKQAIYFKESVGFRVHDTMIWEKPGFSNPESVRYHQVFEYIYILSKGKPRVFNPIKDRENKTKGDPLWFGRYTHRESDGSLTEKARERVKTADAGMRTNVWHGLTAGQENVCCSLPHPAMMPTWLARDLILSWSNPGDVILDPLSGYGTTGVAARDLKRDAILIELSADYIKIARERLRLNEQLDVFT